MCFLSYVRLKLPIPVATRSKAWVCDRSLPGISGSNPAGGMDVCRELCVLSGRDFCIGLITRPEESYRVRCVQLSMIVKPWLKPNRYTLIIHTWALLCRMLETGSQYKTRQETHVQRYIQGCSDLYILDSSQVLIPFNLWTGGGGRRRITLASLFTTVRVCVYIYTHTHTHTHKHARMHAHAHTRVHRMLYLSLSLLSCSLEAPSV
jgi:hypothetical protein